MTSPGAPRQITLPYCGQIDTGVPLWLQFNLDPALWTGLLLVTLAVVLQGGTLRDRRLLAVAVAAFLWISPLCAASASLLAARSVHHVLVMLVLAPLIAAAWPAAGRKQENTGSGGPAGWALAAAFVLGAWFVPAFYTAAWQSTAIYWLMQGAMLAASAMLWRALFGLPRNGTGLLQAFSALSITAAAMGIAGAVLTFAPQVLLVEHLTAASRLGIAPLADQQAAGLFLWLLGTVPMAVLAARAFAHMLHPAARN